ncbi:gas vesicle protein [Thermomonospora catenispora]|uniref:gas vesicle protein n=1 Tax=Thermomonospora catenispora TaxID=2493090 RepID=UPI001F50329D|nr:gas vesicle protein [Thermomonospora catenispora]
MTVERAAAHVERSADCSSNPSSGYSSEYAPGRSAPPAGYAYDDDPPVGGRMTAERATLVDLLDRLLAGGVVVQGDLTLSIADVDLVRISLRVLIASVGEDGEPIGRA